MNRLDSITQQNAAMIEETAAAALELARETEALAALTARFKVGGAG